MKDERIIVLKLSETQAQRIIDGLLFASSCQVQGEWSNEHGKEFMETAFHVSEQTKLEPSNDISYYDDPYGPEVGEEYSTKIKEKFPKLICKP